MRFLFYGLDPRLAHTVELTLASTPHVTVFSESAEEVRQIFTTSYVDAAVFDAEAEFGAAICLARSLRLDHDDTPMLLLGTLAPDVEVRWLETVDAVISPESDPRVIAAYVSGVARRRRKTEETIRFGNVSADIFRGVVRVDDRDIHLTPNEFKMFMCLAIQPGTIVSKREIFDFIYVDKLRPNINIINNFSHSLQKKLRSDGVEDLVKCIWGRGHVIEKVINSQI